MVCAESPAPVRSTRNAAMTASVEGRMQKSLGRASKRVDELRHPTHWRKRRKDQEAAAAEFHRRSPHLPSFRTLTCDAHALHTTHEPSPSTRKEATMNTYARIAAEAGDQYLAAIGQAQENFLNAFATSMACTPVVPVATAPGGDFPTPQEMVEIGRA